MNSPTGQICQQIFTGHDSMTLTYANCKTVFWGFQNAKFLVVNRYFKPNIKIFMLSKLLH